MGWVTIENRHVYIGQDGNTYTGKDAIDQSSKEAGEVHTSKNKVEIKTISDLRKHNNGVGSVSDGKHNFHDKVVVALHNTNNLGPLRKYAEKFPNEFKRLQRAMRFKAWQDYGSPGLFNDWEKEGKMEVHRGVGTGGEENGISWSLSSKIAQSFANHGAKLGWRIGNAPDPGGRVLTKTISAKDIDFYSDAQGEKEVLLGVFKK